MIKKSIRLFQIEMKNVLGINKIIYSNKRFKLLRVIGIFVSLILFLVLSSALSYGYYNSLAPSLYIEGQIDKLITISFASVFLLLFTTNISRSAMSLFSYKDYDTLMSLPIKTGSIILSKFSILYIGNLVSTMSFMIPSVIVYCHYSYIRNEFFLIFGILLLLFPIIPVILSTVVSIVVSFFSYNLRNRKVFNTLVTFLFMAFVIFMTDLVVKPDSINKSVINGMVNISKFFPLSKIFTESLVEYNIVSLSLFVLISFLICALFIALIYKKYKNIHLIVTTHKVSSRTKQGSNEVNSQLKALFYRELKKYIITPVYMINTLMGPLTLMLICIFLQFLFKVQVEELLSIDLDVHAISIKTIISIIFSIIYCIFLSTSSTTSCSISIEGKNYWILQSSPVSYKNVFNSKILLNVLVNSIIMIVSDIFFSIAFRLTFFDILSFIIIQFSFMLFISVLGILVNLKLPKMEWQNESVVVKQSASVLVSVLLGLLGVAIIVASIIASFLFFVFIHMSIILSMFLSVLVSSVIMLIITLILYKCILKHPKIRD